CCARRWRPGWRIDAQSQPIHPVWQGENAVPMKLIRCRERLAKAVEERRKGFTEPCRGPGGWGGDMLQPSGRHLPNSTRKGGLPYQWQNYDPNRPRSGQHLVNDVAMHIGQAHVAAAEAEGLAR